LLTKEIGEKIVLLTVTGIAILAIGANLDVITPLVRLELSSALQANLLYLSYCMVAISLSYPLFVKKEWAEKLFLLSNILLLIYFAQIGTQVYFLSIFHFVMSGVLCIQIIGSRQWNLSNRGH